MSLPSTCDFPALILSLSLAMNQQPSRRVFVVGNGMTKFEKPGKRDWDYPEMCKVAVRNALDDASTKYEQVEQVFVGWCYGDSTSGQRAIYESGLTGIPIFNVNNNCSTGSTALFLARNTILGGTADCVLALGFEKMARGSLKSNWDDRENPMAPTMLHMMQEAEFDPKAPAAAQMFGNAGKEHQKLYGTLDSTFAKIAEKNHFHSKLNPYAQFRTQYSLDQILNSQMVFSPLSKLQCCPTSDGAAAALVVSEEFVRKHHLENQAVEITGMAMTTDKENTYDNMINLVGGDMTRRAADSAFRQAGVSAKDIQVVELHDCFSANELISYEALGLCAPGKAEEFVLSGCATLGGAGPIVNPSGGLISKGHPLGGILKKLILHFSQQF